MGLLYPNRMALDKRPILAQLQEYGFDPSRYPPHLLVGHGGYSLVFAHEDPRQVVKVTACPASMRLLSSLLANPLSDMVRVLEKQDLGALPGTAHTLTAFLLERLEPAPCETLAELAALSKLAVHEALGGATRPPKRGQPGYVEFNVRYCEGLAAVDASRTNAWTFLAEHLKACADPYQSVDLFTDGNILARYGKLVISDPVRVVRY